MEIYELDLWQQVEAVKNKQISSKELVEIYKKRIHSLDVKLNSFITMNDNCFSEAESIDRRIRAQDDIGKLAGVPIAIKDMICTKGIKTTAGSKMLSQFIPPYNATLVERIIDQGGIIIGKTNQDEFAMGSSNETSFFGAVKNPWNLDFVPGGSSGGSAAAQSARLAAASIGTDTGGSIRQPAHFCGIVGVKPTYSRISRWGVIAYASSLDQAGPMTNSVKDSALLLEVMCGWDEKDSTSSQNVIPEFSKNLNSNLKGLKIGLPKEYFESGLSNDTQKAVDFALDNLKKFGAEIVEVSLPLTKYAIPVYYLIASSEASSNLSRYDGVKYGFRSEFKNLSAIELEKFYAKTRSEGFGSEVKRRIMLGTYCLSSGYFDAYYNKASQVRRLIQNEFINAFKNCDVILSPVTTQTAFKFGEKSTDPLEMYLNDVFTTSANLAGLPAMSVPCTVSESGLPIGIQLMAAPFEEQKMLNVGLSIEEFSGMKGKIPNVI